MDPLILDNIWFFAIILLWALPWKGFSLWKSARNGDKFWFIALLIIQTLGILDIIYIFIVSKKMRGLDITENQPRQL